jgi:ABC-2 type transport system ATP-binding protein
VREVVTTWAGTLTAARPPAEALDLAGLAGRASVRLSQLSGGEKRRLDLAVAVLGRPDVLFLDEPTSGLDPESRRRTWDVVRDLLAAGTTVLLTTHYLEEAEALADRIAIMHAGRIVRTGTPEDVAAAEPARVVFRLDGGVPRPDLAALAARPDVRTTVDGPRTVVHTGDLQATLAALLAWAGTHQVRLHDLEARPGSLEGAFLAVADGRDPAHDEPETHLEVAR